MFPDKLKRQWVRFWMRYAGLSRTGRIATRLASFFAQPYKSCVPLALYNPRGYISPSATICHSGLGSGKHVFIGDRVTIYESGGGTVYLSDHVKLFADIIVETGRGGQVTIGSETHIQPRCQLVSYEAPLIIGCRCEIAPNCSFYTYDHSFSLGESIRNQPLTTKGGITVEDDVWLGTSATILDGVRIGTGAVVGAGSVVTRDIPQNAVAFGVPARVVKIRPSAK